MPEQGAYLEWLTKPLVKMGGAPHLPILLWHVLAPIHQWKNVQWWSLGRISMWFSQGFVEELRCGWCGGEPRPLPSRSELASYLRTCKVLERHKFSPCFWLFLRWLVQKPKGDMVSHVELFLKQKNKIEPDSWVRFWGKCLISYAYEWAFFPLAVQ